MIQVDEREKIRKAYYVEKKSMRQIAREMHHSRKTVRRALDAPFPPVYRRTKPYKQPVIAPFLGIIQSWLQEDKKAPHKQRHTARRIYERLCSEYGFRGAESTVRRIVKKIRGELGSPKVYIPLGFDPGLSAQVDWGHFRVIMDGKETVVHIFSMRLSYSRLSFLMAFPNEGQEAFLEGHKEAFTFFGGVPREITYDNTKAAVKKVLRGRSRVEQETFSAFRSHYLFQSNFTTPGEAHEKGQVENLVGYARRRFFVPVPRFKSYEELNGYLRRRCEEEKARALAGENKTIGEKYRNEKEALMPLPAHPFPCYTVRLARVNKLSIVTFLGNRYSVPVSYAYHRVKVRAYPFRVEIVYRDKVIATHKRFYGRGMESLDPVHYAPLLRRKPGAFPYARPIRNWEWPEVYKRALGVLRENHPARQAMREFCLILELEGLYEKEAVRAALKRALSLGCVRAEAVRLFVLEAQGNGREVMSLNLEARGNLSVVKVRLERVKEFNRLLGGV